MNRIEWLKERQTGIGGSDAAAILGVNPFMTALELYEDKTTEIVSEGEMTGPMKRGIALEPIAADFYVELTGRTIRERDQKRHPTYPFMIGNVDREIIEGINVDSPGILEIKCPGLQVMAKVKAHGLEDYMMVQLMHYLAIYGYNWGSFALFNAERWELIHFDLQADQDFISILMEKESVFWHDHVVPRIPPITDNDSKSVAIPQTEGEMTFVDSEEWQSAAQELQEATSLKKTATELEKVAKETVKELMHREEIHAAEVDGFARFYYKQYPGRTSWKKTAENLAKEAGLDVETFKSVGESYTRFNSYFMK